MTGPIARDPLPGEPEWRDRWQDARPGDSDTAPRVVYDPQTHTVLVDIESDCGQGDFIGDVLPHQVVLRAAPSVPPQPTVPRAPVEALLAALDEIETYTPHISRLPAAVAEVRRYLNGDT